jgi:ferredoxin-type protein NapH
MRKMRFSAVRGATCLAAFVLVAIGLTWSTGTGTPSSLGLDFIATICPLGALESMLGSWSFIPRTVIALAAMIIGILFLGKAFCSWVCPIPHIGDVFKSKKRRNAEVAKRIAAADVTFDQQAEGGVPKHKTFDSRHAVLGGALLSTAIFGFPVFCLICPVGLTFATSILLWRFVQFNEPTWGLIIFPAVIIIEVLVLRRWCHRICPLGALLSLFSTFNVTLRPTVDTEKCLQTTGTGTCKACLHICPERVDPIRDKGECSMVECTKCHSCADVCPVGAISFPFLPRRRRDVQGDSSQMVSETPMRIRDDE